MAKAASPKNISESNSNNGLIERIDTLEKEITDLKNKKKDGWDKVQILSALLVPVAIAFAGYWFSRSTKEAEIEIANTNAKVAQAKLVHSFTETLTSTDSVKRKIAIEAVSLALRDDGSRLVETIKRFDPDASVRAFASEKLGATDLFAQLTFSFDNYENSNGIPPRPIFSESAQIEIRLKATDDKSRVFNTWSNRPLLKNAEVVLTTKRQTVNRQISPTVDGTTVTQTNIFDRFIGNLGEFADPNKWSNAKIEAIFRVTAPSDWLRTQHTNLSSEERIDFKKRFDKFYSISGELRDSWQSSDYSVTPVLRTRLEIFVGTTRVADISGIVASVWEHDEDVRSLHVARFVKE